MTTIVLVRKNKEVVVASDGQVSMGNTIIKKTANKVRKIEKRNIIWVTAHIRGGMERGMKYWEEGKMLNKNLQAIMTGDSQLEKNS